MTYREVMEMPFRVFWSFNRQVTRLKADDEMRQLRLLSAVQSAEGVKTMHQTLKTEVEMPVLIEKQFDVEAWEALKAQIQAEREQRSE
jgi:hypothetical protein